MIKGPSQVTNGNEYCGPSLTSDALSPPARWIAGKPFAVFVLSPASRFSVGTIVLECARLVMSQASWSPSLIDIP
jgi:hypothetical protein